MRAVEHVFEIILRLYPKEFRRHYGDEMRAFVHARLGEPRYATPWGAFAFVWHVLVDGVGGAVREHLFARTPAARVSGAAPSHVYQAQGTYGVTLNMPLPRTNSPMCIVGVPLTALSLHGHWMLPSLSSFS